MTDEPGTEDTTDPFHPNNIDKVALVVQMRIYDALMGILAAQPNSEELHQLIWEAHNSGKIVGPIPWLDLTSDEVAED